MQSEKYILSRSTFPGLGITFAESVVLNIFEGVKIFMEARTGTKYRKYNFYQQNPIPRVRILPLWCNWYMYTMYVCPLLATLLLRQIRQEGYSGPILTLETSRVNASTCREIKL